MALKFRSAIINSLFAGDKYSLNFQTGNEHDSCCTQQKYTETSTINITRGKA